MRSMRAVLTSGLTITLAVASLTLLTTPAFALYKVVGPDGKVSYTDRPPTASDSKVTGMSSTGATTPVGAENSALPLALRQTASRFPVVLYTSGADCEPCNAGRQLLRQRGIPYSERSVSTAEDVEAMQKITASRDVPALTIGAQVLSGFSTSEWSQYLDAAGYPASSVLPSAYKAAAATPLTAPKPPPPPPAPNRASRTQAPSAADPAAAPAAPASPGGIRF